MDDLGGITQGIPGFWVVDPHDFDDVKSFHKKVFGAARPLSGPGPDL
jgi:iron complex outermembrane receptor protein